MPTFRKKPVVVEAVKCIGDNFVEVDESITIKHQTFPSQRTVLFETLERVMWTDEGDNIIRDVNNEFYPCRMAIYIKTTNQHNGKD